MEPSPHFFHWAGWQQEVLASGMLLPRGAELLPTLLEVLQKHYGQEYLERCWRQPKASTALAYWPINRTHANYAALLEHTAQIALARVLPGYPRLRLEVSSNLQPSTFVHAGQQLHFAGMARRAGAAFEFEPGTSLGKADGHVRTGQHEAWLEFVTLPRGRIDGHIARLFDDLHRLGWQSGVEIGGDIEARDLQAAQQLMVDVRVAAGAVARHGRTVRLRSPAYGSLTVAPRGRGQNSLSGPAVTDDDLKRLEQRIEDKARQHRQGRHVWLVLNIQSVGWLTGMVQLGTLENRLRALLPYLQDLMRPHPQLAGVLIHEGPSLNSLGHSGEEITLDQGGVAVRCVSPDGWQAETLLAVGRGPEHLSWAREFGGWVQRRCTWLGWALAELSWPPLEDLVRPEEVRP